jgi:hypothetical protein
VSTGTKLEPNSTAFRSQYKVRLKRAAAGAVRGKQASERRALWKRKDLHPLRRTKRLRIRPAERALTILGRQAEITFQLNRSVARKFRRRFREQTDRNGYEGSRWGYGAEEVRPTLGIHHD